VSGEVAAALDYGECNWKNRRNMLVKTDTNAATVKKPLSTNVSDEG